MRCLIASSRELEIHSRIVCDNDDPRAFHCLAREDRYDQNIIMGVGQFFHIQLVLLLLPLYLFPPGDIIVFHCNGFRTFPNANPN